jgi:hypothetical protein
LLKRGEDRADWTTFTAIQSVDDETRAGLARNA